MERLPVKLFVDFRHYHRQNGHTVFIRILITRSTSVSQYRNVISSASVAIVIGTLTFINCGAREAYAALPLVQPSHSFIVSVC